MEGRFERKKTAGVPKKAPEKGDVKEASPKKRSGKKISKIIYIVVLLILLLVFLYSAGSLIKYFVDSQKSQNTYNELKGLKGDYTRPNSIPVDGTVSTDPEATQPEVELVTITDPDTGEEIQVLPEFAELYLLNTDLVGWLTIPGTNVDYPVVQRPESTDYYLHRDFYGNYDSHGCLYVREVCDVNTPSDNITIYGHRMKDHTMLGHLAKYESKEFWQEHQYLYFDTLTEHHTYQIIYVFTTTASVGQGFQYHMFVNAANQEEFNSFLVNCSRNSIYDTGLSAVYGDKLITLSTCEYTQENGRLVVVAKRID